MLAWMRAPLSADLTIWQQGGRQACLSLAKNREMRNHLLLFILWIAFDVHAQVRTGPVLGPVEFRTASVWYALEGDDLWELECWPEASPEALRRFPAEESRRFEFRMAKFYLTGLAEGTTYHYRIVCRNTTLPPGERASFRTPVLWQYRQPAPDFSFLAGSCAYFNEAQFDRPGRPYGGDSTIFETMSKEPAAFMLWLGDNWYYRESDYNSSWGLWYRAYRDRSLPCLGKFWKAMGHYAIWDDHDYGPNNEGAAFVFKEEATRVFNAFWNNPSAGSREGGIYTRFSYSDVDFFLLDSRSFRDSDELPDSVGGVPNPDKRMLGKEQLQWLKNQLANSKASFKIIANGSNFLNRFNRYDCLVHYPVEYNELLHFIEDERIDGVVMMSGDRHHSDVICNNLRDGYLLCDITNSALTSGVHRTSDYERSNPDLIASMLIEQNNYTRASVRGASGERVLKIEFVGTAGQALSSMEFLQKDLRFLKN